MENLVITFREVEFEVKGEYYPSENGGYFGEDSQAIFEIEKVELYDVDFTEFFLGDNLMEELEEAILEKYYL